MATYNKVANFGGIYFEIGDTRESQKPCKLKTNIGKTFIEKEIPLRNTVDIVLDITGIITGLSSQIRSQAIENDRAGLKALEDGYKHAYNDGKHSGDFAIVSRSLIWDDVANRETGEPNKFIMQLIEWN